jgi:hypothetical protein
MKRRIRTEAFPSLLSRETVTQFTMLFVGAAHTLKRSAFKFIPEECVNSCLRIIGTRARGDECSRHGGNYGSVY